MRLRIEGLRIERDGRCVLDVPSLEIGAAPVTAVIGPNGAGKSTLLRAISGLERAARDTLHWSGRRAADGAARIALAPQRAVFLHGSVRRNLDLALRLRGVAAPERGAAIDRAAALLGIGNLLERDTRALSGGEAQRANLARALALPADLILLDEPLAGLDAATARDLLALLPGALAGAAAPVLLVTHDRDEALRLANRAVLLRAGRIAAEGPLPDLFRAPPDADCADLIGFTLIPAPGGVVALAPDALEQGAGDPGFDFTVDAVHDLGDRLEAAGRVKGVRVRARLHERAPVGASIPVHARAGRFRNYPH